MSDAYGPALGAPQQPQGFWDLLAQRLGQGAHYANNILTMPTKLGQGMLSGAMDAAALPGDVYSGRTPVTDADGNTSQDVINRSTNLAGMVTGGSYALAPAETNAVGMGIRAYHGSPHDFDRFDLSKIGTGEGAQAYGHGLYFAENPEVARIYRDTLSGRAIVPPQNVPGSTQHALERLYPISKPTGKMYEVNINAEPQQFLDWEKPISDQPAPIRQVYQKLTGSSDPAEAAASVRELQARMDALASERDPVTNQMRGEHEWMKLARERDKVWEQWNAAQSGEKFYSDLRVKAGQAHMGPQATRTIASPMATKMLQDAGIPGIKYLDQGSRGSGMGTNNYVVFNDKLIDILKKYGMAGLGLVGAASGAIPAPHMNNGS